MKDVRLLVAEMEMMREHLSTIQHSITQQEKEKGKGVAGGVEKDVYVPIPLFTFLSPNSVGSVKEGKHG